MYNCDNIENRLHRENQKIKDTSENKELPCDVNPKTGEDASVLDAMLVVESSGNCDQDSSIAAN